jgi:hypothetical protein
MARFFPTLDNTEFSSKGEFTLFQELEALDDGFTVIHSLPWLRGRTKRMYSAELQDYIQVSLAKKHLSGEVDFVILHAKLGILCIETKSGLYTPSGVQFIHERDGYLVSPLSQVKDNAFVLMEMLKSWQIKCPVGYAVHFPDFDLDSSQIASAYMPFDRPLPEGILILQQHRRDMRSRIVLLMAHWKASLNYSDQNDFSDEIDKFLNFVWPLEAREGHLGRKILADGELWLRFDEKQANQVASCLDSNLRLIAGFSGSGKTLIARALAEQFANRGLKVLFLLKNRQITQKVATQLSHLPQSVTVQTFHSYCESLMTRNSDGIASERNYDEHHLALHGKVDRQYTVLIVDEAQALNEADHLALRDHFKNARKFIFADELQVLPGIEMGSSYRFLEDTYNERFFYLATVYRNPGGVTKAMMDMRPPRHEVNCPRPATSNDLSRSISREISKSVQTLTNELMMDGVMAQDMIVLTQFPSSLDGIDLSQSTISAYRGMERPIVIIVADFRMDDATLACALGRATSRAYIIVPIQLLTFPLQVNSDFLRKGLEQIDRARIFDQDSRHADPHFIANKILKFAGAIGRHEIFGEGFFYASHWRRWIYEGDPKLISRGVQLWSWRLSHSTNLPVSEIDPVHNSLTGCYLQRCAKCGTTTPHDAHEICLTCLASPLDEATISEIVLQAADLGIVRSSTRGQSLINVAALVGNFRFGRSPYGVGDATKLPVVILATTIVEFRMRHGATVATKPQMRQWLQDVLVLSELDDSVESLLGRTISSLCGQKILGKLAPARYRLLDQS